MENKKHYNEETTTNNEELIREQKVRYGETLYQKISNSEPAKNLKRSIKRIKNSKRKRLTAIAILTFVILYGLFSLFISLNEKYWNIKGVPKWHELFEAAGFSTPAYKGFYGDIAVHFIDVGQGDSALVIIDDVAMLIDGGEYSASPKVINYINSLEIDKLDYVIASHPHSDHIGSLHRVIDEFGVDTLVMPEVSVEMTPITSSYIKMIESADECGAKIKYAEVGDIYSIAEDCTLEILGPVADYEDYNNYSIVCRLKYKETSFLFTGDIEEQAERDILDRDIDVSATVLKVAHHGSSTSSVKKFIQAVDPEYAVISAGAPNDYGHPHKETLKLFELLEIEVLRTDLQEDIVLFSDGEDITVVADRRIPQ